MRIALRESLGTPNLGKARPPAKRRLFGSSSMAAMLLFFLFLLAGGRGIFFFSSTACGFLSTACGFLSTACGFLRPPAVFFDCVLLRFSTKFLRDCFATCTTHCPQFARKARRSPLLVLRALLVQVVSISTILCS